MAGSQGKDGTVRKQKMRTAGEGERGNGFWISLRVELAIGMRRGMKERGVNNGQGQGSGRLTGQQETNWAGSVEMSTRSPGRKRGQGSS